MKLDLLNPESPRFPHYMDTIMAIEAETYPPTRLHPRSFFDRITAHPRHISLVALDGDEIAGFCFGAPLELFDGVPGVNTDPQYNKGTVFYGAELTVAPAYRRRGIGIMVKKRQILMARENGFRYVAGRNRLVLSGPMWLLNESLGAYEVQRLTNIYTDGLEPNECIYYHMDLSRIPESF